MARPENNPGQQPKIGLVFDDSLDRADGVQQQLKLMGRWLKQKDWPTVYLCSGTAAKEVEGVAVVNLSHSVAVRANQNRLRLPWPISSRRANQAITDNEIELVHIMLPFSPWLGGKLVKAALKTGLPVIGTFHTYPSSSVQRLGSRLYGWLYRRRLKRFDGLYSVSSATSEMVARLYGLETKVIPNFVDTSTFTNAKRAKTTQNKTVVYVGRLVERKGPQYLVAALGQLQSSNNLENTKVVLIGDGPLRSKLAAQIEQLGLADKVKLVGFVSEQDKASYLAQADLAVYPATGGEAFGIVLLEAMAAGALVLGGDNPGYKSVLNDEQQLVRPTDTSALAQSIIKLLNDRPLRQKLFRQQWQILKTSDYQTVMPHYGQIYAEMLALKAKSSHT